LSKKKSAWPWRIFFKAGIIFSFFMVMLMGSVMMGAEERGERFTAEDILEIVGFARGSAPVISPAGGMAAYAAVDVTEEKNILARQPTGFLWVVPTSGGKPRLLCEEGAHGERPVWSADGRKLAFFHEVKGGWTLGVWDKQESGIESLGEAFAVQSYLHPQWDAAGRRIVYAVPVKEEEPGKPPRVQVVRSTDKRIPGDWFFVDKRRARLVVVDIGSGEFTWLVEEPTYLRSFQVSPDGRHVIYTRCQRLRQWGSFRERRTRLLWYRLRGEKPRRYYLRRRRRGFSGHRMGGRFFI
jgi:dipeptidyl aminopeptidase/acylaminoacyl peptidase